MPAILCPRPGHLLMWHCPLGGEGSGLQALVAQSEGHCAFGDLEAFAFGMDTRETGLLSLDMQPMAGPHLGLQLSTWSLSRTGLRSGMRVGNAHREGVCVAEFAAGLKGIPMPSS